MTILGDSIITEAGEALNGVQIIYSGIDLEKTLSFLENSPVNSEIEEILKAIRGKNERKINDLLNCFHPKTFEEVIWLYKTACALFLSEDGLKEPLEKIYLLERAFRVNIGQYDKNPVYLHLICKSLWDIVKNDQNMIQLCKKLSTISVIGFNVSVCLMWATIFRLLNHPIKMFRFHNFHELVEILGSIEMESLKQDLNKTYTLLQIVSFLQNAIVVRKSNEDIPIRFKSYFRYEKEELELFKNWCIAIRRMFDFNMNNEVDVNSAYTLVYELIELDILYQLENLLHEISFNE